MIWRNTLESWGTLAKATAIFARVLTVDSEGKVMRVALPGHNGRRYEVVLQHRGTHLEAKCLQDFGTLGMQLCKVCARGGICYHVLAAIEVRANEAGYSVSWCGDEGSARLLSNLGGTPFRVQSSHGNHSVWGVWKKE